MNGHINQSQLTNPTQKNIKNSQNRSSLSEQFVQEIVLAPSCPYLEDLHPYIKPIPVHETLLGNSKISQKLAAQVQEALTDLKPILLQGPPGSGKTFIAGFIHAHSAIQKGLFIEFNLSNLLQNRAESLKLDILWIIEHLNQHLGRGTVLFDNVHLLPEADQVRLLEAITSEQVSPSIRFVLASAKPLSAGKFNIHQIKLFCLAQRKKDLVEFADYFLKKYCQERGRSLLSLSQAGLRRLMSYNYSENLGELEIILKRAVIMTQKEQTVIPEQVLWSVQSPKNTFRIDLLNQIPILRRFFLSQWWVQPFWLLMMAVFIPVVILGLVGPQERENSLTLNLFWAWWWPFYLLLFPLVGRLWCSVCPFMITGEWLRKISWRLFHYRLKPWPKKWLNRWGAWLLWAGFVLIYLWEKLWNLPHRAYLSAWLLLIITAGAVGFSLIYERRLWCRYLCPIGGMNGMFAKLSVLELRSIEHICGNLCSAKSCQKANGAVPASFPEAFANEGQASQGCPVYSIPAQLQDNRDCVLCMSCLKTCPNRSVQLNLRFPAVDLWENNQGFWAEAALLLLLLGGVLMHHSRVFLGWFGWGDLPLDSEHLLLALPSVLGLLSLPAIAIYLTHRLSVWIDPEMPDFLTVVYAYLPLTLVANLVYYIPTIIQESGQFLPVMARSFGFSGVGLPSLVFSTDVSNFLVGIVLLTFVPFSVFPLLKITQRPWSKNIPHLVLMLGFLGLFWQLMLN
ncbi:sigma 54-interacting transcriptional regulator [Gloeothece verrucosa]|uniref:Sigma 54 interacting domain protein n=1 Tax=Gloeothece verrucosa (strain PCC 7822) TaxID=497965 RepID=E0UAE3_GLOV7|nr:sigma 54-interacting transcriptional regulator [Gloeothece verrucosa]ADN12684.1 Sigma 54 interacting domain protein [Gloeothece verrucosa PCC 7822]